MAVTEPTDIAIIGAGIIGICVAAQLAEAGKRVTVFDRTRHLRGNQLRQRRRLRLLRHAAAGAQGHDAAVAEMADGPARAADHSARLSAKLLPWLMKFWRAGTFGDDDAAVSAQAGLMKLAESEWMGLMDRSGRGRCCGRTARSNFTRAMPSSGHRSRLGRAGKIRHRLPACRRRRHRHLQPGLSPQFVKGDVRPGLEDGQRSKRSRQGDLALRGRKRCGLRQGRRRARYAVEGAVCGTAPARAHNPGPAAGDRRRRLVASACAAIGRCDPAGNRTRLQHHAAEKRLRSKTPADLWRAWLRHHAAGDRAAGRRSGRVRWAETPA